MSKRETKSCQGEALVSAPPAESLHRPAVDLDGWMGGDKWEESLLCVNAGGVCVGADLDT